MSLATRLSRAARLGRILITRRIRLGDRKYRVPLVLRGRIAMHAGHEPWLDLAYEAALRTHAGAFIDVGVNIGQTMHKVLAIEPEREWIGFEPQLDCCAYVEAFIRMNCLSRHRLFPVGLSNTMSTATLHLRESSIDSTASTVECFRPADFYAEKRTVILLVGDEMLAHLMVDKVGVVKVDVEGGELEVLEGFSDTLQRQRPAVFFEVLGNVLAVTGERLDANTVALRVDRAGRLHSLLANAGYRVFNVVARGRLRQVSDLVPKGRAGLAQKDYVAVHEDRVPQFLEGIQEIAPKS